MSMHPNSLLPWGGRSGSCEDHDWPSKLNMAVGSSRIEVHWLLMGDEEDIGNEVQESVTKVGFFEMLLTKESNREEVRQKTSSSSSFSSSVFCIPSSWVGMISGECL